MKIKNYKYKKNTWYFNIAAVVHMIHNLILYITTDYDYQTLKIETADGTILKIQNVGNIDLQISIQNKHIQINLSNVNLLPK